MRRSIQRPAGARGRNGGVKTEGGRDMRELDAKAEVRVRVWGMSSQVVV